MTTEIDCEALIVGTGAAGLGAAIKLKAAGFDFLIPEQEHEVGEPGATTPIPVSRWTSQPSSTLESFKGRKLHTAQWSDDLDLTGERVAFIGTGATAIQLAPEIAPNVAQLNLRQRTPIWLLPKPALKVHPALQKAFAHIPYFQRLTRSVIALFMNLVFPSKRPHCLRFR